MAIYDLGTASLASNGEVTGVGTTWKAPLTLIRVGATIIFKTNPLKIYTISEITSDTQINVYNPNSETVPAGTGYAILAHDGITVQGLAQDVAETLRYYQSKETSIESLLQFIGQDTFDWPRFEQLANQSTTGAAEALASQVAAAESAATAVGARDATTSARDQTITAINNAGDAGTLVTLAGWGIGNGSNILSELDFQTFNFVVGGNYRVAFSACTNVPEALKLPGNSTLVISVDGGSTGTASRDMQISTYTAANDNFRRYRITYSTSGGVRNYYARESIYLPGGNEVGGANAQRVRGLLDVYSKNETFQKSLNFSDVEDKGVARSNLGISSSSILEKVVDISQLRLREPSASGEVVYVLSHTSSIKATEGGDSGGGVFISDIEDKSSVDDNGFVIVTSSGNRWKRDVQSINGVTPKMFGAHMNAPYIAGSEIQGTPYPKAPSMGAANLAGVNDDGAAVASAYAASLKYNMPLLIERPIYIGSNVINLSDTRQNGDSLKLIGTSTPRRCLIYTSGGGGFRFNSWGHNLEVLNIGFRNADADYNGSPLISGVETGNGGGGKLYRIENVEFYHYKYALPTLTFVSKISNIYMYDCKYGLGLAGNTSTQIDSVWAHHCDTGFLWGYGVNRETLDPIAGGYPVMYVTASNIAADGCLTPHKIGGQLRSVTITGCGIEGVNGNTVFDFSDYSGNDDQFSLFVNGLSCWIQSSMNTGVLRFINLPANESRMPPNSINFNDGYLKLDYAVKILDKTTSGNTTYIGNSVSFGDSFRIVKQTYQNVFADSTIRSVSSGGRVYGDAPYNGRNSYNGVNLAATQVTSGSDFTEVKTEEGTVLLPYNRGLDILLTTVGEESRYGSCFLAGDISLIPINKNGLGGQESGGIIQFSISGSSEANVASSQVWFNKISKSTGASSTSLDGVSISKVVKGSQTYIRISTPTASISTFVCHLKLTYSGFAHYYDRRWSLTTL